MACDQSYEVMYGAFDFSFIAGRVKFLCLNTNATEYDYMAAVPNFDYMEEQFTTDTDKFDRTVVIMHACPYSDQVYGHDHNDTVSDIYGDGLMFYGIDCAQHRNYRIMTITEDGYEMEQIFY